MRRRKHFHGLAAACFFLTSSGLPFSSGELSPQEVHHRCRGTLGHWCQDYLYQASVPWKVSLSLAHHLCSGRTASPQSRKEAHPPNSNLNASVPQLYARPDLDTSMPCIAHQVPMSTMLLLPSGSHWCLSASQDFETCVTFETDFAQVAPQGQKACTAACNGVGNCNADTGLCDCPAGEKALPSMLSIKHAAQMPLHMQLKRHQVAYCWCHTCV